MTINQLHLFIIFLINGIIIGFIFDMFRVFRKSFRHKDYVINIQDVLFWVCTGVILLYSSFTFNDGELRLFMILSAFLGFIIYLLTLSKIIIKVNVKIIFFLKNILSKIIKILLLPIRKLFFRPFTFLVINIKKSFKNFKLSKKEKIGNKNDIKEGF